MSWWSTSATETSKRARTRSFRPFSTWRLPLSESTSGRCSSIIPSATRAALTSPPAAALQRAGDLFGREHFGHVAWQDPGDGVDADAALLTVRHLAHVVLEALERGDRSRAEDRVAAAHAHPGAPHDLALGHVGARDRPQLGDDEDLSHLRAADDRLADLRREHAGQGRLEVVDRLVDDVVGAQVDAVGLRLLARLGLRLHVEAEHDGARGRGQHDVALVDGADRGVDDLQLHLLGRELLERLRQRLHRALHVRLEDEPQLLDLAGLDLLLQAFQRDAGGGLARALGPVGAHGRDLPRLALVGDADENVARRRYAAEAVDFDGVGGPRRRRLLPGGIEERTDASGVRADHDGVALPQGAVLDEHGGHGAAAAVEPALDDHALGGAVGIGLQLEDLGLQRGHL